MPPVKNIKVDGATVTWDKVQNSKGYLVLVYKDEQYQPIFFNTNQATIPANLTPCKFSVAPMANLGRVKIDCEPTEIITSEIVVMDPTPPTRRDTSGFSNNENLRVAEENTGFRGVIDGQSKRYKIAKDGQNIYIKITRNGNKYKVYPLANSVIDVVDDNIDKLVIWNNCHIQFKNWRIEVLGNDDIPLPATNYQIFETQ